MLIFRAWDTCGIRVDFSLYLKTKVFVCSQAFIKMTCVRQQNNVNVYLLAIKFSLHRVLALTDYPTINIVPFWKSIGKSNIFAPDLISFIKLKLWRLLNLIILWTWWLLWLETAVIYAVYFQDTFAMYLSSKFRRTVKLSDCLLALKNISQKSLSVWCCEQVSCSL